MRTTTTKKTATEKENTVHVQGRKERSKKEGREGRK